MQAAKPLSHPAYLPPERIRSVFLLCWIAYLAANLARLSYSVSMAEMVLADGFSASAAGLVGTGFFFCYGGGQLISGYLGDYIAPGHMVLWGLIGSGCANLVMGLLHSPAAMLVVWCLNGLLQAMLWTPILRIIAEYFPPAYRNRACMYMSTTHPIGALLSYGGGAAFIALRGWRTVFFATAIVVLAVAALWGLRFFAEEKHRAPDTATGDAPPGDGARASGRIPVLALVLIGLALVMQGALRDGLTTWIPTFLSGSFSVSTSLATLSATVLPMVNLAGVFLAGRLQRRCKSEPLTAGLLFALASGAAAALYLYAGQGYAVSLICFSAVTACMMGINIMLVSMVPTYFTRFNRVSLVAGILNAMVYVGSSIATYGMGALSDKAGWSAVLFCLLAAAAAGTVLCLTASAHWTRFKLEQQRMEK